MISKIRTLFIAAICASLLLIAYGVWDRKTERSKIVLSEDHVISRANQLCGSATNFFRENKNLILQSGCELVTSCSEMSKIRDACSLNPVVGARTYVAGLRPRSLLSPNAA